MKNRYLNDFSVRGLAWLKIEFSATEFNVRHLTIMLSLGIKGSVSFYIMPVEGAGALMLVCA
jgi:hypothetical protein